MGSKAFADYRGTSRLSRTQMNNFAKINGEYEKVS